MTQPQEPNYPYSAHQPATEPDGASTPTETPGSAPQPDHSVPYSTPYSAPYAPQQGYGSPTYGYATYPNYQAQTGWSMYPPPPPAPVKPTRRRAAAVAGIAAAAIIAIVGVSLANGANSTNGIGSIAAQEQPTNPNSGSTNNGGTNNGGTGGTTNPLNPNTGNNGSSTSTGSATTSQQVGVVDIYTKLKYQQAAAAGTGLVIDSSGVILTNNHVIDGSTSISVVVVATGKTYVAKVVGTAPTEDVAVLQLTDASGLKTANIGDSDKIKVGDAVTGVGNAGGNGGTPSAAAGTIQSLNETITASDESGTDSEKLNGVIVTDAPIQSGDSGGPLFNAQDEVIGIDTAASTSGRTAGFAIPINKAMKIAKEIRSGVETSVIHIGYPAFLGVSVKDDAGAGALIATTEDGLPADKAGIVPGDVITSLNGSKVTSADTLRAAIAKVNPGDTVPVAYTDANGTSHSVQVTLITGPAD